MWDAGVPRWNCDTLRTLAWSVDIGLIGVEASLPVPLRGPKVELKSLNENMADMVYLAQGFDTATSKPIDTTPAYLAHAAYQAPSSSRSTPLSATLVPLARVMNFEAQMATLMHYIQPWMLNFIVEAKDWIEKRVV